MSARRLRHSGPDAGRIHLRPSPRWRGETPANACRCGREAVVVLRSSNVTDAITRSRRGRARAWWSWCGCGRPRHHHDHRRTPPAAAHNDDAETLRWRRRTRRQEEEEARRARRRPHTRSKNPHHRDRYSAAALTLQQRIVQSSVSYAASASSSVDTSSPRAMRALRSLSFCLSSFLVSFFLILMMFPSASTIWRAGRRVRAVRVQGPQGGGKAPKTRRVPHTSRGDMPHPAPASTQSSHAARCCRPWPPASPRPRSTPHCRARR